MENKKVQMGSIIAQSGYKTKSNLIGMRGGSQIQTAKTLTNLKKNDYCGNENSKTLNEISNDMNKG